MADIQRIDDRRPAVPDVLALDDVATGQGASLVVAVAATVAVMLAVTVATLSGAAAAPTVRADVGWTAPASRTYGAAATFEAPHAAPGPVRVAEAAVPGRDGVFRVVSPAPKAEKSVAFAIVLGLFLAMAAGTSLMWRALGRSVTQPARRPGPARAIRRR